MKPRAPALRSIALVLLAWAGLVLLFTGLSARAALERATQELNATGSALHRMISQRVAQHDAHLTSIVALAQAATPPPEDAIRQVVQSIMRFYPRVTGVSLVELAQGADGVTSKPVMAIPKAAQALDRSRMAGPIFQQRPGEVRAYVDADAPGRYLLGKRASSSNPGLAILMEINPALLVEPGERPAWARMTLGLDKKVLWDSAPGPRAAPSFWQRVPSFSGVIDSQSQPLRLTLDRHIALLDLIDLEATAGFAVLSLIVLLLLQYAWNQRLEARRLRAATAAAEQKTQRLEHETRLAHASRVNSLGELASGIAHELAQPLTALLSQSQAALRLAASGNHPALLAGALEANVREAKRAGQMLDRMRDYISNRKPRRELTDLNQVVSDISELMHADLAKRAAVLALELETPAPLVVVDAIEMEQVLHNLIRNAADSLEGAGVAEKRIRVRTFLSGDRACIMVTDNGPGITEAVLPRLFEPFFSTKANGMGLGLSLCATLLERVDGRIEAGNATDGGACFTVFLPAAPRLQQAAQ